MNVRDNNERTYTLTYNITDPTKATTRTKEKKKKLINPRQ
jgi:hypothetical protein